MKNKKLNKFIEDKWENYSWGLSLSAGINEFLQVLYHNNIDVDKLDFDVE